jgi:DNA-directed RNA polymerase subunit RPC12/RpoP
MEKVYSCVGCSELFKIVSGPEKSIAQQHEVERNVECPYCHKINAIVWPQGGFLRVMTQDGRPTEHLQGVNAEILSIAKQLIAERLGIIAASRKLAGLRHYVAEPQIAEVLLAFAGIDSETDTLPVGDERKQWDPEALQRKDREIEDAERFYRDIAIEAATEAIRLIQAPR